MAAAAAAKNKPIEEFAKGKKDYAGIKKMVAEAVDKGNENYQNALIKLGDQAKERKDFSDLMSKAGSRNFIKEHRLGIPNYPVNMELRQRV